MSVLAAELMSPFVMKISEVMLLVKLALIKFLESFHMKAGSYMVQILRLCFEDLGFFAWTNIVLYVHYFLVR